MIKSFFEKHNINYVENASLKKYNTYKLDTTCNYLVFPKNEEELINILRELKKENIKYLILGNGSNIILAMNNYDGVVIKLDNLNSVEYQGNIVTVGAGYSLIKLAVDTINNGLSGLEFAAGIPGLVGASTAMNAGAYNSSMSEVVTSARVLTPDLELITMTNKDLEYAYRDSFIKKNKDYYVLSTTFELTSGDKESMLNLIGERRMKRLASQPLNMPSAGSVFRNPEGLYAGGLIEESGLKGHKIGGAKVSEKHANFIVNDGNATGEDIVKLIKIIQKEVKENYNVELILEQIIIE
ncbi:MAG: UDP-N-acetylmuramate dehydrogenase [Bacilli bacterium]|nr:UDP-N-acetylmuramate dehydrogenase [Bacilli bacterium]